MVYPHDGVIPEKIVFLFLIVVLFGRINIKMENFAACEVSKTFAHC